MAYTTPPQFSGTPPSPPRQEIDFNVISESFNLLIKHWQVYIIPGLIIFVLYIPIFIVAYLPLFAIVFGGGMEPYNPFATIWLQFFLSLGASIASMLLYPGISRYTLNVIRGLPASSSDLWIGFRDPLGYLAIAVFTLLVTFAGVVGCCIGVLFTAGLMMFALPIKVDTNANPLECVARSWELLKKDWLLAGVFYLVVALVSQIGGAACGIGAIFTMPFHYIAPTVLYQQYTGWMGAPSSNPLSPYPRGGVEQGHNFGEQSRQKPEGEPPPKPDDYS